MNRTLQNSGMWHVIWISVLECVLKKKPFSVHVDQNSTVGYGLWWQNKCSGHWNVCDENTFESYWDQTPILT